MSNDIFSGLEDLGFEDIDSVNLYKKDDDKKNNKINSDNLAESDEDKQKALLYDVQVTCPICENSFKARTVKNLCL